MSSATASRSADAPSPTASAPRRVTPSRGTVRDRLAMVVEAQHAIAAAGLDTEAVLTIVLDHATALTGADAGAVELIDREEGERLVYRAACGRAAPFVGLGLALDTSLSGICIRSGTVLRCGDAELDARVDREACRRVGARSLLVVPLRLAGPLGTIVGVLKVSSSVPDMFDDDDAGVLELLAGFVAAALHNSGEYAASRSLATELRATLAVLHENEERFRNAFEHAGIGMALVGLDGRWLRVNRALCRMIGYTAEELGQRTFQDVTHPGDLETDLALLRRLLAGEIESYEMEKRYLHRAGRAVTILLTASLVRDTEGQPLHFIAQVQDISARKAAEAAQARLSAIVETMPDMVATCEPDGRIVYLNRSARRVLGFGDSQPDGLITVSDVQPQFAPNGALADAVEALHREGIWRGESTLRRPDGREMPVEEILLAYPPDGGARASFTAILRDITERKHTESALQGLALLDELTGLYNRRGFLAFADKELRNARRSGWPVLLFYGDMDGFKGINDVHGHAEGDRALADAAGILRGVFRESDILGRIGGDEFTALVPHGKAGTETQIRERLQRHLAEFNATAGRPYALSMSLGAALCPPDDARSLADLFAEADAALLRRKRERRAR